MPAPSREPAPADDARSGLVRVAIISLVRGGKVTIENIPATAALRVILSAEADPATNIATEISRVKDAPNPTTYHLPIRAPCNPTKATTHLVGASYNSLTNQILPKPAPTKIRNILSCIAFVRAGNSDFAGMVG